MQGNINGPKLHRVASGRSACPSNLKIESARLSDFQAGDFQFTNKFLGEYYQISTTNSGN